MSKKANSTSFKKGHQMTPEQKERWRLSMIPIWEQQKNRKRKKWTDESKTKLSHNMSGMNHPRAVPILSERIKYSRNLPYIVIKINASGRWIYKHRYIMEQHLCRQLQTYEFVHHVNGDTLDNRIENLCVLFHGEHTSLHSTVIQWATNYKSCQACNTIDKKHVAHGLCTSCYQKEKAKINGWPKKNKK